jgi:ABC-type multidrug transport system ATPase subunit
VDEPTAGLDPEERNRFNNLLVEIGEQVVVILSTHIVEDVADLCSRMAILVNGRLTLQGAPAQLMESLRGRVWSRTIEAAELAGFQTELNVIAHRLRAGRKWRAGRCPDTRRGGYELSLRLREALLRRVGRNGLCLDLGTEIV